MKSQINFIENIPFKAPPEMTVFFRAEKRKQWQNRKQYIVLNVAEK